MSPSTFPSRPLRPRALSLTPHLRSHRPLAARRPVYSSSPSRQQRHTLRRLRAPRSPRSPDPPLCLPHARPPPPRPGLMRASASLAFHSSPERPLATCTLRRAFVVRSARDFGRRRAGHAVLCGKVLMQRFGVRAGNCVTSALDEQFIRAA